MEKPTVNGTYNNREVLDGFKFEEVEIPVPWGQVRGKWWGSRDRQPILAIHGWQDNSGTWDNLIPLLSPDTSILCIDLPGHGFSSHYPPGMNYYIFWDGISLIRRIVKYFKWSKITLMGHSLGGGLSFMYAANFPDDVDKYISIDIASPAVRETSVMIKNGGNSIDKFLHYETLTEDQLPCYTYDEMVDIVYDAYKGDLTRENCEVLMRRGMTHAPPGLHKDGYHFTRDPRLKVSGLAMMAIEQALEYAAVIRCKVLNIRAIPGKWEKPDYYTSVVEKLKETTQVEYHEMEGTHYIHLNDPHKISGIITQFLNL